ncbi:ribosomal RNA small subunit methyltransferase B [Candidatus Endolissoclinum faulkneri L5]|uniref:Ribosomal RNA small subunit methyltransferase B n=1 Tax=Candidatus Endolissoclinum faulkneri L5 TaxID=1401328 RepID=V9TRD1_9PROT|nr:RsmB/NOP family class I SAM-dependent RNA methyltransferase [Candidatus Endolissoclinum faulkneri]AHC73459.1 ribosomal RNA small subunit methyltransferase B [Candidatus Endolissoclinum faulkneri L5]
MIKQYLNKNFSATTRISAPRKVAFDLLRAVLVKKMRLSDALINHSGNAKLSDRDRNFARSLVANSLRRLGHIDQVINSCLKRPLPRQASIVRDVLRIAATELLILNIPPYATIHSAVNLVRSQGEDQFTTLTNAVLRRIDREARGVINTLPAFQALPKWLTKILRQTYGEDIAMAMVMAMQQESIMLDITVKTNPAYWAKTLGAKILPTGTLRRKIDSRIDALLGFNEGAWWVQNTAAAIPVQLLGDVRGKTVIDLCAAPGGKTAQLAARLANVIAVDQLPKRVKQINNNLDRLQLAAKCIIADATKWRPQFQIDALLLDAPCSATGLIQRHPDIPWLKSQGNISKMAIIQDQLLNAAFSMVKPGGIIIFSTCSLLREEGSERIEALFSRNPYITRKPITSNEIGGLSELINEDGDLLTRPDHLAHYGGIDGFYACRLIKNENCHSISRMTIKRQYFTSNR